MSFFQRALQKLASTFAGPDYSASKPRNKDWGKKSRLWLEGKTCIACGAKATVVHHKWPFHLYPEYEMCEWNWRAMCEGDVVNCHLLYGHSRNFSCFNPHVDADCDTAIQRIKERASQKLELPLGEIY